MVDNKPWQSPKLILSTVNYEGKKFNNIGTREEHLKEEALAKMFEPVLMTTPKDLEKIMAASGL